jgi:putative dimethyl sulfoxide reductase chaperone
MDIQEFISHEKARADCFRFLSACFYQPHKEFFLLEDFFNNLASLLKIVSPDVLAFAGKMENAFIKYSEEDLMVDYAKLFVGPNELLAPPYGSVYLDKERRVMGNSTMDVIKMYEEEGLSIDEDFKELPDHIAVELEFMYYLISKELESFERSEIEKAIYFIKTQEVFLDRFLRQWVTSFCEKIKEGTENKFYKALADCVHNFIINEKVKSNIPESLFATKA